MYYNGNMKLKKTHADTLPNAQGFASPVRVQGGTLSARGRERLAESGGRFKLACASRATLFLLKGEGYAKWERGEVPFAPGDVFSLEGEGEIDLYGKCVFIYTAE